MTRREARRFCCGDRSIVYHNSWPHLDPPRTKDMKNWSGWTIHGHGTKVWLDITTSSPLSFVFLLKPDRNGFKSSTSIESETFQNPSTIKPKEGAETDRSAQRTVA
jgi:hypothetical protein